MEVYGSANYTKDMSVAISHIMCTREPKNVLLDTEKLEARVEEIRKMTLGEAQLEKDTEMTTKIFVRKDSGEKENEEEMHGEEIGRLF